MLLVLSWGFEPKKLDIDVFLAKLLLGGSGFWQAEPWGLFGARQVVGYREDLKRGVYIELKRVVYRVEDFNEERGVYRGTDAQEIVGKEATSRPPS